MDEIKERTLSLMADIFGVSVSKIPDSAAPGVLEEWDSLKHLMLTIALEEEFQVRFSDQEMADMLDLPSITSVISVKCRIRE